MHPSIEKLLSISGPPLAPPAESPSILAASGASGGELLGMLQARNGFFAYESALLVRPLSNGAGPAGIVEWNEPSSWKALYGPGLDRVVFFGEDIFGCQFGVGPEGVHDFDPETGDLTLRSSSLAGWVEELLANDRLVTGHPIAHHWQSLHGPLPPGHRLVPIVPFMLGGAFALKNLHLLPDLQGMRLRADLHAQTRDIPDGGTVQFKIVDDADPSPS